MAHSSSDTCIIDDVGPFPVVRPRAVAELGDVVRQAANDGKAIFPLGGRTMLDVGKPPTRAGIGVDLTGLTQVIDYPAADMTITVQTGITITRLQDILRGEGQWLPIDVPQPETATLGGTLAVNVSGSRRLGFGTLRDYVIGISTINDEGQETKAGGRVVKNVAGYDLCKLHVGALGTLGIITQVTLKLKPLPEQTALVVCRCDGADVGAVLDQLHSTRTRPVCIDVLNPAASRLLPGDGNGWSVVIGFEESAEAVRWQVQQMLKELSSSRARGVDALVGPATTELWRSLAEFQRSSTGPLTFKANLLPHGVADFCRLADGLAEATQLQAHAGNGIINGHVSGELSLERAQAVVKQLQEHAEVQGNVVIRRCPVTWKASLPIWGKTRGDTALMAAVREKMDPRKVFNPGRFVV